MRECPLSRHAIRMRLGSLSQGRVPVQRRQPVLLPILVGEIEDAMRIVRTLRLDGCGHRSAKPDEQPARTRGPC